MTIVGIIIDIEKGNDHWLLLKKDDWLILLLLQLKTKAGNWLTIIVIVIVMKIWPIYWYEGSWWPSWTPVMKTIDGEVVIGIIVMTVKKWMIVKWLVLVLIIINEILTDGR